MSHQDFPVRDAQVRVFDRSTQPGVDDANDMYVLVVFGISVLIRLRTTRAHPASRPQLYIHIDNEEMTDVRWFPRAEVLSALRGDHPDLHVPAPIAIAHHLIKAWAEGEVRWE